ncbi:nitroreductase/quinone reductase family protein [Actinoplanes sp. NPDC049265]|uniref:nitroreductase/quinone reductase family protein n=1 Tax=Actinoplanes sp. NPDC049265 TaxID=3363902 RepID=UPI00371B7B68
MSRQISRPNDFNLGIIAEFRRSSGRVESHGFASRVVLLHHIGARTGRMRVTPLGAMPYEDSWIVVGVPTPSGGPTWAMNLRVNPDIYLEVGIDLVAVRARALEGEERTEVLGKFRAFMSGLGNPTEDDILNFAVFRLERRS